MLLSVSTAILNDTEVICVMNGSSMLNSLTATANRL